MSMLENDALEQPGASNGTNLDDLYFLNFPSDVDWSTTLVLRCDPAGAPYRLIDVSNSLHHSVRRNDVHNLSPTALNYVFTISFKTDWATENFVRHLKDSRSKPLTVKDRPCVASRVPTKAITLHVRWIPADIDSLYIVEALKRYGTIVKTYLVKNDKQGWFHVYTGERKIQIDLHDGVTVNDLPYSLNVKGLYGAVLVAERNPKCLDCYYHGHKSDTCKHRGCAFNRE